MMNFLNFGLSRFHKENILLTIKNQVDAGSFDFIKISEILIMYYKKIKKHSPIPYLEQLLDSLRGGEKLSDALVAAKIINEDEAEILITSKDISSGIQRIVDSSKEDKKIWLGFVLLIGPILGIISMLYFGRPYVHKVMYDMTAPIRDTGATPPPIPSYFTNDNLFLMYMIIGYGGVIVYFSLLYFFHKRNPKLFFELFPVMKIKYTKEVTNTIRDFVNSGINVSQTLNILSRMEKNHMKKRFYAKAYSLFSEGKPEPLSTAMEDFHFHPIAIMLIKQGEMGVGGGRNYQKYLTIAAKDAEERYQRALSRWLKASFWLGQIIMMAIAAKPMIDILLYMSIQQMNFSVM